MALGAFIAGMVVGQSEVSHQAAADALPMRDAFAVLFFVSVGMLFDPNAVWEHPLYLLSLLAIILLAKPLAALGIIWVLGYSVRTGLVVALALAQIGEFSFILADLAHDLQILSPDGQSLLVTCALISIALNPLLFRAIDPIERWLRGRPHLWRVLNRKAQRRGRALNIEARAQLSDAGGDAESRARAIVVGYGPVGQTASRILEEFGLLPVIVDLNLDTVRTLNAEGTHAIYGDATQRAILEQVGINIARYLLVTIPEHSSKAAIIMAARNLNPDLKILTRSRYIQERMWLEQVGATTVCSEEAEVATAMATLLLDEMGASEERVRQEVQKVRETKLEG
jgi:CPA2 family monovalent cation:H+ antiporter-2